MIYHLKKDKIEDKKIRDNKRLWNKQYQKFRDKNKLQKKKKIYLNIRDRKCKMIMKEI